MKLIGLTGGIATGKSTVSQIIRDQGLVVIDADILSREVVEPGSFGLRAIVEVFGTQMLDGQSLNRSKLREKIFNDEAARLVLERIVHPLVQWRAQQEFHLYRCLGHEMVFYDAALIFEKNLNENFDYVMVVYTPLETQQSRLMKRDKIKRAEVDTILASQWPIDKKSAQAKYVIDNGGELAATHNQVLDLIKKIRSE